MTQAGEAKFDQLGEAKAPAVDFGVHNDRIVLADKKGFVHFASLNLEIIATDVPLKTHYGNESSKVVVSQSADLFAVSDVSGYVTVFKDGAESTYFSCHKKAPVQMVF